MEKQDKRDHFLSLIHRVAVGTLFLSACVIPSLKLVTFNAAAFSQNRVVSSVDGSPVAVIEFRTQHLPILHSVAQYSVLEAFLVSAARTFRDQTLDPRTRHGIATAFKAAALGHFSKSVQAMNERCGWQGQFEHNQVLQLEVRSHVRSPLLHSTHLSVQLEMRGVSTAEGDIRVLAIRTYFNQR